MQIKTTKPERERRGGTSKGRGGTSNGKQRQGRGSVVAGRERSGEKEYLVKWSPSARRTWATLETLIFADTDIGERWASMA